MNRRTIRRYAHEIYPHGEEGEIRDLAVEVPYWYSRVVGLEVMGTGWRTAERQERMDRLALLASVRRVALLADALSQGIVGQEAWDFAAAGGEDEFAHDLAWERAVFSGVPVYGIKPYPCGPEPDQHDHLGDPDSRGNRPIFRVYGKESECPECTEEVDA